MGKVFFNFPITLLKPAFIDIRQVCNDIMDYAIYMHGKKLIGDPIKRMEDAAGYFGIDLGDVDNSLENARILYKTNSNKSAMTGINKDLLFEYYKNYKTDSEIAVLLAFLALKSILGKKSYCRITSDFLLCRMAGYTSKKEMNVLPEDLKKYRTRWNMDSLKRELKNSFGLKIYGRHTRGFFVSFNLSDEQLIKEVEMKRKKYIEKIQKDEQSKAVKKVLMELYSSTEQDFEQDFERC